MRKQTVETVPQDLLESNFILLFHYLELYVVVQRWNHQGLLQLEILFSVSRRVSVKVLYSLHISELMTWPWLEEKTVALYLLVRKCCHLPPRSLMELGSPALLPLPLSSSYWTLTVQPIPSWACRAAENVHLCGGQGSRQGGCYIASSPSMLNGPFKVINLPFLSQPQSGYRELGLRSTGMWLIVVTLDSWLKGTLG